MVDICSKADSPNPGQAEGESFYEQSVCVGGLHAEMAQSTLTVIFKLLISGLANIILIVLGTVNLQFQGKFVCFFEANSWNCVSLCHGYSHAVNFFCLGFQYL